MLLLFTALIIASCGKGPETVIVKSDPSDLFNEPDSTEQFTEDSREDTFRQLRVGEVAPIESLDPLFASSNSEWRILDLVYDGLTDLDSQGNPVPALAKRWTVNEDSTEFVFHLTTTTYYHDSPVFDNGVGRKFTAKDVRYVFERMASNQVPEFTARHFMDLRGFSAFHNEQAYVKNPARRVLSTIEGLKIRNDSTVVFLMNKPAGDLLSRLAHPMASIYPEESVTSATSPIQQAAGTGNYHFIKKEGNAHLFTSTANDGLNRLDIVSGLDERTMYQQFAQQQLDALVEVSPSILQTIADSSGALYATYYKNYDLQKSDQTSSYSLYYNEESGQAAQVNSFLSGLNWKSLINTDAVGTPKLFMAPNSNTMTQEDPGSGSASLIVTQSNHPIMRFLLDKMAGKAVSQGNTFSMNASYALTDRVSFSTSPYPGTRLILKWESPIYTLTQGSVKGIQVQAAPWKLDLHNVKTAGADE